MGAPPSEIPGGRWTFCRILDFTIGPSRFSTMGAAFHARRGILVEYSRRVEKGSFREAKFSCGLYGATSEEVVRSYEHTALGMKNEGLDVDMVCAENFTTNDLLWAIRGELGRREMLRFISALRECIPVRV